MSVPLSEVLGDLRAFLEDYQSEVVIIQFHTIPHPINGDKLKLRCNRVRTTLTSIRDMTEVIELVKSELGTLLITDDISKETRIADLVQAGSRVLMLNEGRVYPTYKNHKISSHKKVVHFDPEKQIQRCKTWCE